MIWLRFVDGHYWVWNDIPDWLEQFPFFSESTLKRIFSKLKKNAIVRIEQFDGSNRTNFYRIDYEKLDQFLESVQKSHEVKMTPCEETPSDQNDLLEDLILTSSPGQNDLFLHTEISHKWGDNAREKYINYRLRGEGINSPVGLEKTIKKDLKNPNSKEFKDFENCSELMNIWPKQVHNLYRDFVNFGRKNRKICREIAEDHRNNFGVAISPMMFEIAFYESSKTRQSKGVA